MWCISAENLIPGDPTLISNVQMYVLERKEIRAFWERIITEGFMDELWTKNFRITWDTFNELCDAIEPWWCSGKSPVLTFSLEENCTGESVHHAQRHLYISYI